MASRSGRKKTVIAPRPHPIKNPAKRTGQVLMFDIVVVGLIPVGLDRGMWSHNMSSIRIPDNNIINTAHTKAGLWFKYLSLGDPHFKWRFPKSWGTAKSPEIHHILGLKPMVTWGSIILRKPQIELIIEKQENHQLFWNVNYLVSSQHHSMDEQQDLRFAAVFVS